MKRLAAYFLVFFFVLGALPARAAGFARDFTERGELDAEALWESAQVSDALWAEWEAIAGDPSGVLPAADIETVLSAMDALVTCTDLSAAHPWRARVLLRAARRAVALSDQRAPLVTGEADTRALWAYCRWHLAEMALTLGGRQEYEQELAAAAKLLAAYYGQAGEIGTNPECDLIVEYLELLAGRGDREGARAYLAALLRLDRSRNLLVWIRPLDSRVTAACGCPPEALLPEPLAFWTVDGLEWAAVPTTEEGGVPLVDLNRLAVQLGAVTGGLVGGTVSGSLYDGSFEVREGETTATGLEGSLSLSAPPRLSRSAQGENALLVSAEDAALLLGQRLVTRTLRVRLNSFDPGGERRVASFEPALRAALNDGQARLIESLSALPVTADLFSFEDGGAELDAQKASALFASLCPLSGAARGPGWGEFCRYQLNAGSIQDKDGLLRAVKELERRGLHASTTALTGGDAPAWFARKWHSRDPQGDLLAWDLCQAVQLVQYGYAAGLLSAGEALEIERRCAARAQGQFPDYDSYLDGWLMGLDVQLDGDARETESYPQLAQLCLALNGPDAGFAAAWTTSLEGLPQAPGPSGPPPWVAPASAALLSAMLLAALTALSAVLLHNKKKRARARRKGSFRL